MRLEGQSAIVTGGARGIGLAVARRLIDEGACVTIADIDDALGEAAAKELSAHGRAVYVSADVSERLDVINLVTQAVEAHGPVTILVNNAGISHDASFLDLEEKDFDRVLGVNLKGAFLCGQAVARHMVEEIGRGGRPGAIVNMSSINAELAIATQVPYSISKGGVRQLTHVMALALAPHRIRVNAVGPGSIMTDMLASVATSPEMMERIMSRTPLGRLGDPSEIAAIVAFLASDEASYITGQTIYADGGRMALNYTVPVPGA
jgi:Dehydrogenases with different specificities (related to short-chain alcohol dehydrogenases)